MSDVWISFSIIFGLIAIVALGLWIENLLWWRQFNKESDVMCAALSMKYGMGSEEDASTISTASLQARMTAFKALYPEEKS